MKEPIITVMEEGVIRSLGEFLRLDFIDWKRERNSHLAMDSLGSYFINRASYTILEVDLYQYPERSDFPVWHHTGSNHTEVGKAFWNFFHYYYKGSELHFHDMPDFSGVIRHNDRTPSNRELWGDVGKVSPIVIKEMVSVLRYYSIWMSVSDWNRVVIIEPLVPVTSLDPSTFGKP